MRSLLLCLLFVCAVFAQDISQLLLTSTLSATNDVQISFTATALADQSPVENSFKINGLNFVVFNVPSIAVHNHTAYPQPLDDCELKNLRKNNPAVAPFYEPQTIGFSVARHSVRWDSGNIVISGSAKTTYDLYNHIFPTANNCQKEHEDCDSVDSKYITVAVTLTLSSSTTGGIGSDLQSMVRSGRRNITALPSWSWDYRLTSSLSAAEKKRNLTDFDLFPSRITKANFKFVPHAVIDWVRAPLFYAYRNLKIQPVGIDSSRVICINIPCTPILIPDLTPTGIKGLNFGKPEAIAQWKKSGISFTWLPLIKLTDSAYKQLDNDAEIADFRSQHTSADAIEIFFAHKFVPHTRFGGGACYGVGSANAKIVTTEYMIDDCGVDKTHLAHEIGHVLGLWHPNDSDASHTPLGSTNTLMCPSGYCNDNPKRNSRANQDNAANPLLTFVLSNSPHTADDCQNNVDCGAC